MRRFLSVAEVARELGVSAWTIYGMISEHRLPFRHHKFGRRVLVDRRELERWAREQGIADGGDGQRWRR
jgi:excisionase family DNA binding protein